MWAGWRLEADIGVTSEPFVSSFKVAGRWDPRVLELGASIHLPTFPCVLLGSRNSLVLQGGRVLGVSELEWVTLHCVHDHIAHAGNESFWLFYTGFALFFFFASRRFRLGR